MDDRERWIAHHGEALEAALSAALNEAMEASAVDPIAAMAQHFVRRADGTAYSGALSRAAAHASAQCGDVGQASPTASADAWTARGWLGSLGIDAMLEAAILRPLGEHASHPEAALAFVRSLGQLTVEEGAGAMRELLFRGGVLDALASELQRGAAALATAAAATGAELHSKFVADGSAFELSFGSLETYYGGLEALIGPPNPKLAAALKAEHCDAADSSEAFTTPNYSVTTTSATEYYFVADPAAGLAALSLAAYPSEARCEAALRRTPRPLSAFAAAAAALNARLEAAGVASLLEEELISARLYTGPLFLKYNAVLRGYIPALAARARALTLGNEYTSTVHCINSALVKTSKLQAAATVYRGVSGGVLPPSFWQPDAASNVRGGVEFSFLSTTLDRRVAMHYAATASADGRAGVLFEIRQGLVDRGADLSWLSQYPFEREICFGPLTGLEVSSTSVEGSVLVLHMRLNVNLQALTIEQVVSKRRKLCADMCANMEAELP